MTSLPTPAPEDPLPVVASWLAEISASGRCKNPNAMALATCGRTDAPSVRMVLVKGIAPAGYAVFYTNYESRKGTELEQNPRAAAVLYWEPLGRQVRFEGPVVRSPADIERAAARAARELGIAPDGSSASRPVPRPAHWGGYRLWFNTLELWAEGANRFHERLLYRRALERADAFTFRATAWSVQRLQP